MPPNARQIRAALLLAVVVLALPAAIDFGTVRGTTQVSAAPTTTSDVTGTTTPDDRPNGSRTDSTDATPTSTVTPNASVGDRIAYTVDAHGPNQITVYDRRTDRIIFTRNDYNLYHDVDPSPAGTETLLYAASEVIGNDRCPESLTDPCMRNYIERVNYSTGETERLYKRTVAYNGSSAPHDVDRLGEDRYLVADIQFDRIFILDTTTDEVVWEWEADAAYDRSTGGREGDWTHLNDVEVLEDDLYMVSLRNQDQVAFVHRERGLLENRTLGAEDDYEVLYEAHNPDYIPRERGGPAILVADSENSRIVEYQWEGDTWANGSWNRSWLWADETLAWPRDADRLPNGNTLITDTHGLRLLEVAPSGEIVWMEQVGGGLYEAELLATGAESAGGHSMAAIGGGNATNGSAVTPGSSTPDDEVEAAQRAFLDSFPSLVLHGFLFVLPSWVTPLSGAFLLFDVVLVVLWGLGEGVRFVVLRRRGGSHSVDPAD